MLNRVIDFTLAYRWLVLMGIVVLLGVGGYALYTIPVEAFPDLTNNQLVVVTEAPSLPPSEIEQLVTYPIERSMLGLPNKEEVRSLSKLGLSMVTVVRSEEHTSELQSLTNLVCRLLLEKKKKTSLTSSIHTRT